MTYYFYRDSLEEYEQEIYDILLDAFLNMDELVRFPVLYSIDDLARIWHFVLYDDPMLFYVSPNFQASGYNGTFTEAHVTYTMDSSTARSYSQAIEQVADSCISIMYQQPTEYDMVVSAYEQIIQMCEYGFSEDDQHMGSVFLDGISCCAGYSRAFQYLMSLADVPCVYVVGESYGVAADGPHAWNLAYVEGSWCWFDLTWGDPLSYGFQKDERSVSYDYCGVSDMYMDSTHYPEPDVAMCLPQCNDDYNDWYARKNLLFDEYNEGWITDSLYEDIMNRGVGFWERDGFGESAVKFSTDAAFDEACRHMVSQGEAFSMVTPAFHEYNLDIRDIQFMTNPGTRSVHMTYYTN